MDEGQQEGHLPADYAKRRELADQDYRRKKAEEEARKWNCDCPSTGKQKAVGVLITLVQAVILASLTSTPSDDDLLGRVFVFWIITGVGGFVLYVFARRDEHWFLIGRHVEGPTLPKRLQRIAWESKKRAGVNPGPEPMDAKGIARALFLMLAATAIGVFPVSVGILLSGTRLGGWGFLLGVVGVAGALWFMAWCIRFARTSRKPH